MYVHQKKYPQNCTLFVDGLDQVNVCNLIIACCMLERLPTAAFFPFPNAKEVLLFAKNVKAASQTDFFI